jgi:hypothetical protein
MTIPETTLEDALAVARKLQPQDRARLIARLAEDFASHPERTAESRTFDLPVLTGGIWSDDLPLRRETLYDDDERC